MDRGQFCKCASEKMTLFCIADKDYTTRTTWLIPMNSKASRTLL